MLGRKTNVQHGENSEDKRLHEANKGAQDVYKRSTDAKYIRQAVQHDMIGRNVPIKSKVERQNAQSHTQELNGEYQPSQPPNWARKVL